MAERFDICVVGAGLIGLAVARALADRFPGAAILVLEKETEVAQHQSMHNSGVVHSGLYYSPGSLKARLCVEGRDAIFETCVANGIRHRKSGKLVIATRESELPALDELERRGRANGLRNLRRIGPTEISEIEPAATGLSALHVLEAGVADYSGLAAHQVTRLEAAGGRVVTGHAVTAIEHSTTGVGIVAGPFRYEARTMVNCAGLQADKVAAMAGIRPKVRIVPFRGEYYRLSDEAAGLIRGLVYPVPDPRFPFLGVHFTRRVDDEVEVGPNAVLALGREHYRSTRADWGEFRSLIADRRFRKLARQHWVAGARELITSRSQRLYARLARRLIPEVRQADLLPGGAGVRAQAVDAEGRLVDDFVIETAGSSIHVLNAPSPGATSSIAIGRYIANEAHPDLSR